MTPDPNGSGVSASPGGNQLSCRSLTPTGRICAVAIEPAVWEIAEAQLNRG